MALLSMFSVVAIFTVSALSQQLQGPPMGMPYNVSASCMQALRTNVSCPDALASLAIEGGLLDNNGVSSLCESSCLSSLETARSTIAAACTTSSDLIVYNDDRHNATFFADSYIYAYNLACRKDSRSGQYCDPQLSDWASQIYLNSSQLCSDCWLGTQALQLNNTLGYDPGLADKFDSLTSSCSATRYSYMKPVQSVSGVTGASALSPATATATPPQSSSCTDPFTVEALDTCQSISQQLNVSTYSLLYSNNLDIYCQNFDTLVGTKLCPPPRCATYTWQALDTCASVAKAHSPMAVSQFLAWNPNFNNLCQNGANFIGYEVCVSPPGGSLNWYTSAGSSYYTSTISAAPRRTSDTNRASSGRGNMPSKGVRSRSKSISISHSICSQPPRPTQIYSLTTSLDGTAAASMGSMASGEIASCIKYYTVQSGDTCENIETTYSISFAQLLAWNPSIGAKCGNLQLGSAYCVQVSNTENAATVSATDFATISVTTIAAPFTVTTWESVLLTTVVYDTTIISTETTVTAFATG